MSTWEVRVGCGCWGAHSRVLGWRCARQPPFVCLVKDTTDDAPADAAVADPMSDPSDSPDAPTASHPAPAVDSAPATSEPATSEPAPPADSADAGGDGDGDDSSDSDDAAAGVDATAGDDVATELSAAAGAGAGAGAGTRSKATVPSKGIGIQGGLSGRAVVRTAAAATVRAPALAPSWWLAPIQAILCAYHLVHGCSSAGWWLAVQA